MIVPVRCEGGSVREWGLIELQGSIQLQREWDFAQGLPVGTIQSSPTDPDQVQLQIGYHLLEGKRLPLKKPLAILAKQQHLQQQQGLGLSSQSLTPQATHHGASSGQQQGSLTPVPPSPQVAAAASTDGGGSGTAYQVVGVLRYKYLFKTRAKALISKPQR